MADEMVHESSRQTSGRSALASPWLTAVLVLAALVLGSLVGLEVYDDRAPAEGATAAAVGEPALGRAARTRLQDLASRSSDRVLSYRHASFDDDVEATSRRLTPELADEYAAAMSRLRDDTLRDRIDQRATAVSAATVSATDARAQVLVFVNEETTSAATRARRVSRNRLVVDLVRQDGAWVVAGVTALG
jgi:Mce-associated membrane protein